MSWSSVFLSNPFEPYRVDVGSSYGAPMGRRSDKPEEFVGKANLRRVPFVDGDYDPGGAYWGGGRGTLPLYADNESHEICTKALLACRSALLRPSESA